MNFFFLGGDFHLQLQLINLKASQSNSVFNLTRHNGKANGKAGKNVCIQKDLQHMYPVIRKLLT
jgi:hypothetical protein